MTTLTHQEARRARSAHPPRAAETATRRNRGSGESCRPPARRHPHRRGCGSSRRRRSRRGRRSGSRLGAAATVAVAPDASRRGPAERPRRRPGVGSEPVEVSRSAKTISPAPTSASTASTRPGVSAWRSGRSRSTSIRPATAIGSAKRTAHTSARGVAARGRRARRGAAIQRRQGGCDGDPHEPGPAPPSATTSSQG